MSNRTEKVLEKYRAKQAAGERKTESLTRESVEDYKYNIDELSKLKEVLESSVDGLEKLHQAYSLFSPIPSPAISPDGKLGGAGYVQRISDIKASFIECINALSDINDTLADELNNPLWIDLLPSEEKEDIEELLEEKEKIEEKVGEDDILIDSEIEDLEEDQSEESEEIITFDIPQKKCAKISSDTITRKINQIHFQKTGKHLTKESAALIKQIYLKSANLANLGRRQKKNDRIIELQKMYKAIAQYHKVKK